VLVDENGAVATDTLATPKSSNRSKIQPENTGRWWRDGPAGAPPPRARRSERSLGRPPRLLDGDGDGTITVHGFRSRTLDNSNARPDNALPRQMYDAMSTMWSGRERGHRKRHADVVVYRKSDSAGGDRPDEAVDIVPLADTAAEHRIRVNLTVGSDDPDGSPVYSVSLSLPGADQRQPVPDETVAAIVAPPPPPAVASTGTECECFCPCLDQDDDDDDHHDDDDDDDNVAAPADGRGDPRGDSEAFDGRAPRTGRRCH